MEQNNFEKDIQQKMGELKIAPSDSVWLNIEKHIGKKDKKRRAIFIIFFLLLFLSLGGFWFINSLKNNQQKNEPIASILEKGSKTTNSPNSSFNKPGINTGIMPNLNSTKGVYLNKKIQNKPSEKITSNLKVKIPSSKIESAGSKPTNNQENKFVEDNQNNSPVIKDKNIETKIKKETVNIKKETKPDSLLDESKLENIKKDTTSTKDSLIKKYQKKNKKHHWNFEVTFSGGTSVTKKNPKETNYLNTSGNITTGGVPVYYYNPSEIKNSTSFDVGIFLEKNISDKNKISFGISYQYLSLVNKVGRTIVPTGNILTFNSSGNFYSADNTIKSYRNQFHFLEVPVSFNFRINKSKNVPIFWNAGINISELISSNALQFQSNPGIYYNDNSLLNKTQFGLHTGFSVILFAKEKIPFKIGPYFYYSPTNIANKGLYSKMHFSSIGIQAKVLFQKK